jgi:hypothetical protein
MNKDNLFIIGGVIAVVALVGLFVYLLATTPSGEIVFGTPISTTSSNITNIYAVQCPFGQYFSDTHGSFWRGSGDLYTNLAESYSVKYMDGNELKTIIMPLGDSQVLVDGNFYVKVYTTHYGNIITSGYPSEEAYAKCENNTYSSYTFNSDLGKWVDSSNNRVTYKYEIHLPYLPQTNNMTSTWGGT